MQKPHLHTHQIIRVLQKKVGSFSVAGGSQKSNADLFTTNAQQMRIYFLCWLSTCRNAYLFQPNLCPPSAHSHHFDSLTFGCRRRQVFLHYFCFCALSAFDDQDVVGWRKKKWNAKCIKNEQRAHQSILKWLYSTHTRVPAHASILMMATARLTCGERRETTTKMYERQKGTADCCWCWKLPHNF